jgi:hypothetical protein
MPLNLVFTNGQLVDAAQLNAIVLQFNTLEGRLAVLEQTVSAISKSQLLVLATKNVQQVLNTMGQNNIISGLNPRINVNSILNAATGIITTPISGTYTIEAKTLVSADVAQSPRSKLTITAGGNPVGVSEDTVFSTNPVNIDNYRYTHFANATIQLNANTPVLAIAQVWGASTGRIFADINTTIKMWLEI